MFDYLVKIMIEAEQELPDFWADRKPEDGDAVDFDDNSDDEGDGEDGAVAAEGGATEGNAW
jgi:ATP-dependent RNA helicase DDX3X